MKVHLELKLCWKTRNCLIVPGVQKSAKLKNWVWLGRNCWNHQGLDSKICWANHQALFGVKDSYLNCSAAATWIEFDSSSFIRDELWSYLSGNNYVGSVSAFLGFKLSCHRVAGSLIRHPISTSRHLCQQYLAAWTLIFSSCDHDFNIH